MHVALQLLDIDDKTPVSWACSEGHEEVVSLLLAQLTDSLEVSSDEPDEVTRDFADDSLPEMVYGASRETLSQQGYRMVGSHSAVKQCRWTRNALRGQGQCYKHTFYGISSIAVWKARHPLLVRTSALSAGEIMPIQLPHRGLTRLTAPITSCRKVYATTWSWYRTLRIPHLRCQIG